MAHSLRRPVSSAIGLTASIPRRCFSQYRPLSARDASQAAVTNSGKPAMPSERSLRVMSRGFQHIPSDVGLLESTFVRPTGRNVPHPLWTPNDFLTLLWNRAKFRFRDYLSLIVLKVASPAKKRWYKRTVKLSNSAISPIAVALHRQMYTAFAESDTTTLRKLCSDGIYDSFRGRIGNRAKGEKVEWELMSYNRRAKVVSNRAARLPIEGAAIRQAVVRISSKQKLTRWRRGKGGLVLVEGTGKEKDVVEYVVVQRRYENWKEGDWQVWGTTKETTLDDVDEWKRLLLE